LICSLEDNSSHVVEVLPALDINLSSSRPALQIQLHYQRGTGCQVSPRPSLVSKAKVLLHVLEGNKRTKNFLTNFRLSGSKEGPAQLDVLVGKLAMVVVVVVTIKEDVLVKMV